MIERIYLYGHHNHICYNLINIFYNDIVKLLYRYITHITI